MKELKHPPQLITSLDFPAEPPVKRFAAISPGSGLLVGLRLDLSTTQCTWSGQMTVVAVWSPANEMKGDGGPTLLSRQLVVPVK